MTQSESGAGRGPIGAGTLEMLILKSLSAASMHGCAIAHANRT